MARVTGIGGIFFKADDPAAVRAWYHEHLGLETDEHGWSFLWRSTERPEHVGRTVWGPFAAGSEYFDPSEAPFMVNFRVDDLDGVLQRLREAGAQVMETVEDYEYGRFGWFVDPAGVKIELWEPRGEAGQEPDRP